MADFNPNPYRGEESIPHVSEDFFKVYFMGAQVLIHKICSICASYLTKNPRMRGITLSLNIHVVQASTTSFVLCTWGCKLEQTIYATSLYALKIIAYL